MGGTLLNMGVPHRPPQPKPLLHRGLENLIGFVFLLMMFCSITSEFGIWIFLELGVNLKNTRGEKNLIGF